MNAPAEMLKPATALRPQKWTELNQQWLTEAIARLRRRLESRGAGDHMEAGAIEDCVGCEEGAGFTPALIHCVTVFELSPFERELLLLVAGLELDHGLRAAVMALNSGVSA